MCVSINSRLEGDKEEEEFEEEKFEFNVQG